MCRSVRILGRIQEAIMSIDKAGIQTMIKGCRAKKPNAQRDLVDRFSQRLYAICIRYIGDRHKAQDVLQEVFIRVFDKFHLYDPNKGPLYSWLSTIAVRYCINDLKKNKQKFINLEFISSEIYSQDMSAIEMLSKKELLDKISDLPDGYRQIFNLYAIEGYSHKEIAEIMKFQEVTSRSKFHRARKILIEKITFLKYRQYG